MVYEITGPLFFGAANTFLDIMNEVRNNTDVLIIKLKDVPNIDATAYESLKSISQRCKNKNIVLLLAEVNRQPLNLLKTNNFFENENDELVFNKVKDAINYAEKILKFEEEIPDIL
jgi:SulP family sulfate permease